MMVRMVRWFLLWLVRVFIRPAVDVVNSELGWMPRQFSIDDELRKQLNQISQERVKLLLDDKLAQEVHSHAAKLQDLEAKVVVLQGELAKMTGVMAELQTGFTALGKQVVALHRLQSKDREYQRGSQREVATDTLEFGHG